MLSRQPNFEFAHCESQSLRIPFCNVFSETSTSSALHWLLPDIKVLMPFQTDQEINKSVHSCVSAGLLHSVHLGHTKACPGQKISTFSTSPLGCWNKKSRVPATMQLRKEDLWEDMDTPQTEAGFGRMAEQSSHRRKPWSSCCPEAAPQPPFPLSSSCPCEGFAFRKCPAIIQMTLCFITVLKMKKAHPHATTSHTPPPLPSLTKTTAIEPGVPSTIEEHHRAGATARWRCERDNVWTLCGFLRGLTYPETQWFRALTARQYVTDGVASHMPSQRTPSSDNNNNNNNNNKNPTPWKPLCKKLSTPFLLVKEENKVYDNCSTLVSKEQEKKNNFYKLPLK